MEYAAHINKEKIQLVQEHCEKTAELCRKYCSSIDASKIGYLQGFFHDTGKFTKAFDDYIRGISSAKRGDIDHCYAGAKYINENFSDRFINVAQIISRTIISHHGLHDWIDSDCTDYFSKRVSKNEEYDNVKEVLSKLCAENMIDRHFENAETEFKKLVSKIRAISEKDNTRLAFYLGMLERFLQSCLIDADRTDTASFMLDTEINEFENADILWKEMQGRMQEKLEKFKCKTDLISLQRQSISDRCAKFAENNVRVCRLIVPTGGGKTLSSLRFAVDYCKNNNMERIIYTAPFMSILEQNSDEIRSIAGDNAFIEHHSNILAEMASDNVEECSEFELHTERWDLPVIATTLVQFLNTLFSYKTTCVRRMHRLSKAVIIIDEIQSLPQKCVNLFNLAINFLTNICGATVVLCSATQPVNEETKYPLIIDENQSMTGDYRKDFEVFARTEIVSCINPYGWTFEETVDFCLEKYSEAGNLLVIVNTKASALRIYELLKEKCKSDTQLIYLSTNMCPLHRKEKLKLIRKMLDEKKPVVCVTTQLIEAGVDISFKCVVRSLSGLDNAVQAAGRCNRHGEYNKKCPVYLIKIKDEKLGCLKEISTAQTITQQMLEYEECNNWQSNETVSKYFRRLYGQAENLSYPVKDGDKMTNLVNLLSLNKKRYETYKLFSTVNISPCAAQAFKTAGQLFQVIDSNTLDVIVPYNEEAEALIIQLEKFYDKKNIRNILRKVQKYTVSIYKGTELKLSENNALRMLECGAVVLDKAFYNDKTGVVIESVNNELYIF